MHFVVTGANRGIGLEFVRQLAARGASVHCTARDPAGATELQALAAASEGRVRVHALDVTDDASVARFASALPQAIDVLINNAGRSAKKLPLEELPFEEIFGAFDTNAMGPLRVTRALLPALRRGATKKVLHISTQRASLTNNVEGDSYGYRMSKAALNMAVRSLAIDYRDEGIVNLLVHPGWVQTDMGGPQAPTPASESVERLLAFVDAATLEHSGRFFNYTGEELPW